MLKPIAETKFQADVPAPDRIAKTEATTRLAVGLPVSPRNISAGAFQAATGVADLPSLIAKFSTAAGADGVMSRDEYDQAFSTTPRFAQKMWEVLDADDDGTVTLAEFVGALKRTLTVEGTAVDKNALCRSSIVSVLNAVISLLGILATALVFTDTVRTVIEQQATLATNSSADGIAFETAAFLRETGQLAESEAGIWSRGTWGAWNETSGSGGSGGSGGGGGGGGAGGLHTARLRTYLAKLVVTMDVDAIYYVSSRDGSSTAVCRLAHAANDTSAADAHASSGYDHIGDASTTSVIIMTRSAQQAQTTSSTSSTSSSSSSPLSCVTHQAATVTQGAATAQPRTGMWSPNVTMHGTTPCVASPDMRQSTWYQAALSSAQAIDQEAVLAGQSPGRASFTPFFTLDQACGGQQVFAAAVPVFQPRPRAPYSAYGAAQIAASAGGASGAPATTLALAGPAWTADEDMEGVVAVARNMGPISQALKAGKEAGFSETGKLYGSGAATQTHLYLMDLDGTVRASSDAGASVLPDLADAWTRVIAGPTAATTTNNNNNSSSSSSSSSGMTQTGSWIEEFKTGFAAVENGGTGSGGGGSSSNQGEGTGAFLAVRNFTTSAGFPLVGVAVVRRDFFFASSSSGLHSSLVMGACVIFALIIGVGTEIVQARSRARQRQRNVGDLFLSDPSPRTPSNPRKRGGSGRGSGGDHLSSQQGAATNAFGLSGAAVIDHNPAFQQRHGASKAAPEDAGGGIENEGATTAADKKGGAARNESKNKGKNKGKNKKKRRRSSKLESHSHILERLQGATRASRASTLSAGSMVGEGSFVNGDEAAAAGESDSNGGSGEAAGRRTAVTLVGIVIVQLVSFVLWHSISVNAMEALVNDLATQINHNVIRRTKLLLMEPVIVQSINTLLSESGSLPYAPVQSWPPPAGNVSTADFFDSHYVDQARIFNAIDLIYSGDDARGRFEGAKRCEPEAGGTPPGSKSGFCNYARDETTGLIYRKTFPFPGTIYRNLSNVWGGSTTYDPRLRPWYINTPAGGWPGWSPIYPFTTGALGISGVQRFAPPAGAGGYSDRWATQVGSGVFATDFTLADIDRFLKDLTLGPRGEGYPKDLGVVFIVERDGKIVGTSAGASSFRPPNCQDVKPKRIQADEAGDAVDPLVFRTANELKIRLGGFATDKFSGDVGLTMAQDKGRTLGKLIVRAQQIAGVGDGLDWLSVVALQHEAFFRPFNTLLQRAIVVVIGLTIFAALLEVFASSLFHSAGGGHGDDDNQGQQMGTQGETKQEHSNFDDANNNDGGGGGGGGGGNDDDNDDDDEYEEDFVDVMTPIEEHAFVRTGLIPTRISRYYAAMRKVLQVQVNYATRRINQAPHSQVVPVSVKPGEDESTADNDDEDPTPEELDLAVNMVLDTAGGVDANHILWFITWAPTWLKYLNALTLSPSYSWAYMLVLFFHCFLSFAEAPSGRGFRSGAGWGVWTIAGLGLGCILCHAFDNISRMVVGYSSGAKLQTKLSMIRLVLVVAMFVEWIWQVAASESFAEAEARQQMRVACGDALGETRRLRFTGRVALAGEAGMTLSVLGADGACLDSLFAADSLAQLREPSPLPAGNSSTFSDCLFSVNECVQYCANTLPRPVAGGSAAFAACAEGAVTSRLGGSLTLKDLQPVGRGILEFNILLLLPILAILRPCLLILRLDSLRRAMIAFTGTLIRAGPIFIVFGILLVIATVQGVTLFYNRGLNFDTLGDAFVTVFIFMISAENYPDLVWEAVSCNTKWVRERYDMVPTEPFEQNTFLGGYVTGSCSESLFQLYFVFYSFLGIFLMLSLVIGVFEGTYSEKHERNLAKQRRKRRMGLLVAFYVLDKDKSDVLEPNEFVSFLQDSCNTGLRFDIPEGFTLEVHEFIELMEELVGYCRRKTRLRELLCRSKSKALPASASNATGDRRQYPRNSCGQAMHQYFTSNIHGYLMLGTTWANLWVLMLYPSFGYGSSDVLDYVSLILQLVYIVEIVLRIIALGPTRFWYRPNDFYAQAKSRYVWELLCFSVLQVIIFPNARHATAHLFSKQDSKQYCYCCSVFFGGIGPLTLSRAFTLLLCCNMIDTTSSSPSS